MNASPASTKNINWLLLGLGMSIFTVSLFNKKTRAWSLKLINLGAGLVVQHLRNKYLSNGRYNYARIVSNDFPMYGNKGGKSDKKRTFKKSSLKVKPAIVM